MVISIILFYINSIPEQRHCIIFVNLVKVECDHKLRCKTSHTVNVTDTG